MTNEELDRPGIFDAVLGLAAALGVSNIKDMPDSVWVHKVDENWTIATNAGKKTAHLEPDGCMPVDLGPFELSMWWNGWLAGLMSPGGGMIAAHHEGASADRFVQDLKAAAEKAKASA